MLKLQISITKNPISKTKLSSYRRFVTITSRSSISLHRAELSSSYAIQNREYRDEE